MSMLYLVRHGQASAGTDDYDRLSPLGQRQSQLLGQWWREQGFQPHSTFHGSLRRQTETAKLALTPLELHGQQSQIAGLNEYEHQTIDALFGQGSQSDDPDSMTFDEYLIVMERWKNSSLDSKVHNYEPWGQFSQRGWKTIREQHAQAPDNEHQVFFTSGGVIATILTSVLNLDFSHTIDAIWRIRNASITTLHFDGKQARLVDFNTVPHLQAEKNPSLITLI